MPAGNGAGGWGWYGDLADPPSPAADSADATSTVEATAAATAREPVWPPPLPAGAVDVGATDAATIAALERSSDPQQQRLGFTIDNAKASFADTLARGGRLVALPSASNGGAPVLAIVPPGFDPSRPARVHTHYHGFNATVGDARGHSSGTTARIEKVQRDDPQTVFVLPECGNAPRQRYAAGRSYKTDWSNVKDVGATADEALAALGVGGVGRRVVSAHSGGGAALAFAAGREASGSALKCDQLELEDSLYGSEVALRTWAATPAGRACGKVVYFHGTNLAGRDRGLRAAFGARYQRIDVDRLPRPAGTPARNPHDRTVADHMDWR